MEETRFRFKLIHWFLTGIDRGLYNDTNIVLDEDCFGDGYVQKLNEYEYLWTHDPFGDFYTSFFPEVSLTYQLFYMVTAKCDLDHALNDYMLYCWYKGCWPDQVWF